MKIIVQENLWNEHFALTGAARKAGFEVVEVQVVPFSHETRPPVPQGAKLVFGSTTLMKLAIAKEWKPGIFYNDNFNVRSWFDNWGTRILNYEHDITTFEKAKPLWDPLFVRPVDDLKTFTGRVMEGSDFVYWQSEILKGNKAHGDLEIKPDTKISISPVKEILEEYRLFIVGGRVITSCLYRQGGRIIPDGSVAPIDVHKFTKGLLEIWKPHHSFVVDICRIKEGLRLLEVNCLNASGFYNCYMIDVMKALWEITYA